MYLEEMKKIFDDEREIESNERGEERRFLEENLVK